MLLEVANITKYFPFQNDPVLDSVSFALSHGERVGIIGPSGSGKTTLARIIARLEKADGGFVAFNGSRIDFDEEKAGAKRRDRASAAHAIQSAWLDMQMVFQNPEASFSDYMNIGDAIWEGAAYRPSFARISKAEREERVCEMLEAVGLDASFSRKRSFELSGGECQRAAIARAVIGEPQLIICDEATSALDVTVQAKIMKLLDGLYESHGMAFLFISHNLALVHSFCDRVYSL